LLVISANEKQGPKDDDTDGCCYGTFGSLLVLDASDLRSTRTNSPCFVRNLWAGEGVVLIGRNVRGGDLV
jgi:hypothetical protein